MTTAKADSGAVLWSRFGAFLAQDADRFTILRELLEETALDYRVITLGKNRHFYLAPEKRGVQGARQVILTAHYDRAPGSPGANDNSAAVFLLIEAAKALRGRGRGNWGIVFTDREELREGESLRLQGSYSLACGLKKAGLERARVFCFDACGAGETVVISTTASALPLKARRESALKAAVRALREQALGAARTLGLSRVLLLPTPFSDDAGFLAAGIAAQTITALPTPEANALASACRKEPRLAGTLAESLVSGTASPRFPGLIPATWRVCNTPDDTRQRLTPQHHRQIIRLACQLCEM
ncbi:MAG: M28 family peptidase [Treponematales bacterium]